MTSQFFTLFFPGGSPALQVSVPAPPSMLSLPKPAVIGSLPLPPVTVLLPSPALMTSLPSPPSMVSLPGPVVIVSLPAPPLIVLKPVPPTVIESLPPLPSMVLLPPSVDDHVVPGGPVDRAVAGAALDDFELPRERGGSSADRHRHAGARTPVTEIPPPVVVFTVPEVPAGNVIEVSCPRRSRRDIPLRGRCDASTGHGNGVLGPTSACKEHLSGRRPRATRSGTWVGHESAEPVVRHRRDRAREVICPSSCPFPVSSARRTPVRR